MTTDYINKSAVISSCGKYRYSLMREWRGHGTRETYQWLGKDHGEPKACVFVMLNPSTADGEQDDPTIRRCVSFAQREKYDMLIVVNLFAYRATKPEELFKLTHKDDPVGVKNQDYFNSMLNRAGLIICAWGAHGGYMGQDQTALGWMDDHNDKLYALGFTSKKIRVGHTPACQPKHPLYVKSDTPLVRMP